MLEDRFVRVTSLLEEHNGSVSETERILPDEFIANIKAMGGTSLDRLKKFSHEEILECMPDGLKIKPKILAKEIAGVFREGSEKPDNLEIPKYVSSARAERMSIRELLTAFTPDEPTNSVGKRLKEISKNKAFLVYDNDFVVNVDASFILLNEIKKGYPAREFYSVEGTPTKVYKIGQLPAFLVDENPIYVNRPLRPDGTCDQLGRSWEGIPLAVRRLVRLIRTTQFEPTITTNEANDLMDLALEGFDRLKNRYQSTYVKYAELEKNNQLPRLKIELKTEYESTKDSVALSGGQMVHMQHQGFTVNGKYYFTA